MPEPNDNFSMTVGNKVIVDAVFSDTGLDDLSLSDCTQMLWMQQGHKKRRKGLTGCGSDLSIDGNVKETREVVPELYGILGLIAIVVIIAVAVIRGLLG